MNDPLQVSFVGPVRRPGPQRQMTVDVKALGLETVAELMRHLGYKDRELKSLHVLADGARRELDQPLEGVESVEILIAIGGG